MVGLDPDETAPSSEPTLPATTADAALADPNSNLGETATTTLLLQPTPTIPANPCSGLFADYCVDVPLPVSAPTAGIASCITGANHDPGGTLTAVPGSSATITPGNVVKIRIEIEDGLAIDGPCFAAAAMKVLTDERGWSDIEAVSFVRVDDDDFDLRLILASPSTTDSLCYPARTAGRYSCRKGSRVIINLMRWESGTDDYSDDLTTYRSYLINHEVGHFLGKGHVSCPAAGEPAPVMMQQTKGLGECLPNGWPTKDEH